MFGHYPHGSSFHSDLPQYQVHLHIQVYMLSLQRFPLLLSSLQTVVAIYFSYMEIFGEKPDMGTGTYRPRNSHQWSTDNKTPWRHSCLFLTYRSRAGNHGDHAQSLSQNRLLNNLFFTEQTHVTPGATAPLDESFCHFPNTPFDLEHFPRSCFKYNHSLTHLNGACYTISKFH